MNRKRFLIRQLADHDCGDGVSLAWVLPVVASAAAVAAASPRVSSKLVYPIAVACALPRGGGRRYHRDVHRNLRTTTSVTEQKQWSRAGLAQQAAVFPVRQGGPDIEVCLIRRRDRRAWGIPKGFIESGDSREETALNEAWEEAGIRGPLLGEAIGTYQYAKLGSRLTVAVYVMRVDEQLAEWPEMRWRQRRWVSMGEAASMLRRHPVRSLLDHVRVRLGHDGA